MDLFVIAIDLVGFSLIERGSLKTNMKNFFESLQRNSLGSENGTGLSSDDVRIMPTGDGAILVWKLPEGRSERVAFDITVAILQGVSAWMQEATHSLKVSVQSRVGIHSDSRIELVNVLDKPNAFGQGIVEACRIMSAADPNQVLLSDHAYRSLFEVVMGSDSRLKCWGKYHFFDKHMIKYTARNIGLSDNDSWLNKEPKSTHEFMIHVGERGASEQREGDLFLQKAASAQFIALTYRTLGAALRDKLEELPNLTEVKLGIFPLRMLKERHPLRRGYELEEEWITGLSSSICGLFETAKKVERIEVRILGANSLMTASVVTCNTPESETRIRVTPVLNRTELVETPTMNVIRKNGTSSQLFQTYEKIIGDVWNEEKPFVFTIERKEEVLYENVKKFVDRLKDVCNNPKYSVSDILFSVGVNIYRAFALSSIHGVREGRVRPTVVSGIFQELIREGTSDQFMCECGNFFSKRAIINVGDNSNGSPPNGGSPPAKLEVDTKHIVGSFVLMTINQDVILIQKPKPGWELDVPGGKAAGNDRSAKETVVREVFEEVGLILDQSRLSDPIAFKYDGQSAKEGGVPVIAVYYSYLLDEEEDAFLRKVQVSTKGDCLLHYPISRLIEEKERSRGADNPLEAICHAPLEAICKLSEISPLATPPRGRPFGCR